MQSVSYLAIWKSMVRSTSTGDSKAPRLRKDGRKSLLVYLPATLIKDLKKAALDDDRNTYDIVEEAAQQWLARRDRKRRTI